MRRLPRIVKILSIRNYVIRSVWNNGEVRDIDFKPFLQEWKRNKESMYDPLNNPRIFRTVSVSPEHTLYWGSIKIPITFKGVTKDVPLDLDPDVLYQRSTLVGKYEAPHVGNLLREARRQAGLSQKEVAINSGTTRNYISRIENEQSDIQIETLFKIVRLGIGKELKVLIE